MVTKAQLAFKYWTYSFDTQHMLYKKHQQQSTSSKSKISSKQLPTAYVYLSDHQEKKHADH
jgi:hypothetical protein